jgi:UDP-N-acetylglucosamine 2-epimerase (non-hydrolysing)
MKKKKVAVILGTRPEIIKLSPLIPLLDKQFKQVLIHTGQHYSKNMSEQFFVDIKLRRPDYNLKVGAGSGNVQVGKMLTRLDKILEDEKPDVVIVQGDTNSTLGGALAASKHNIPIAHIEAGCRCWNRTVPEEGNRILVSHLASLHFPIDKETKENLYNEGIKKNVHMFSNTAYEACVKNAPIAIKKGSLLKKHGLKEKEYALVTIHRADNRSNPEVMKKAIKVLNKLAEDIEILFPIHPGTKKFLKDMKLHKNIHVEKPVGYIDFLQAVANAKFILADSGGIVDEAAALKVPLMIFRNETERNEVVQSGKAHLVKPKWSEQKLLSTIKTLTTDKNLEKTSKAKLKIDYSVCQKMINLVKKKLL